MLHRGVTQAGAEQPVEHRGRAAALGMAEHRHPRLEPDGVLDGVSYVLGATRSFGEYDDSVAASLLVAVTQLFAKVIDVALHLRYDSVLCTGGDRRHGGEIARV